MDISKHIAALVASGVTVSEIAKQSNVNRATIYRVWGGGGSGMRLATAQAILKIKPNPRKASRKVPV